MPAGLNALLDKQSVDLTVGSVAQKLNVVMRDIASTKRFIDAYQDTDFTALGYTPGDIANIRSAYGDLDQLRTIYEGAANLAAAKDFRTFAQRLYGTGIPAVSPVPGTVI